MDQEELETQTIGNPPVKERPTGFGILLMLSGLSGVFSLLGGLSLYVITAGLSGQTSEEINAQLTQSLSMFGLANDELMMESIERIIATGPVMSVIGMIVGVLTIISVVKMLKYKRIGFHLYCGTKIIETFLPAAIAGTLFFSPLTLMLSVLFIYFYSRFLRLMGE